MSFENICPQCSEIGTPFLSDGRDFFVFDGNSDCFELYFCEKCNIGYSLPAMTDERLAPYYPDDFEAFVPKRSFSAFLQRLKYKSDLNIIGRGLSTEGASIFEIGAGRGEFLAEAVKNGFTVDGVEPGAAGRKYAQAVFKISLSSSHAREINFSKSYDVVVMRHVLEHINDPLPLLKRIYNDGLFGGGGLFLKLPRLDSWEARLFGKFWHGLDLPRHRVHFTKAGIVKLLVDSGFNDVKVTQEITPLDVMRSVQYYGRHGSPGLWRSMAKLFSKSPKPVKFLICQLWGIVMMPFGPGRMIVTARKGIE